MLRISSYSWYQSLKLGSIINFYDQSAKLILHFSTNIIAKNLLTKIFAIMQREDESTRTYLQRLNEEILNLNRLLKPITTKALINRVYNYFFLKKDCILFLIKSSQHETCNENNIKVEETSIHRKNNLFDVIIPLTKTFKKKH